MTAGGIRTVKKLVDLLMCVVGTFWILGVPLGLVGLSIYFADRVQRLLKLGESTTRSLFSVFKGLAAMLSAVAAAGLVVVLVAAVIWWLFRKVDQKMRALDVPERPAEEAEHPKPTKPRRVRSKDTDYWRKFRDRTST
jgi:hypothetical protein